MLAFVVLVPWKGKQHECVSHQLMAKVILETVNVNIFSESFDRGNKTVKEDIEQAWRQKDLELNLWVPPAGPLTQPPMPSSSPSFL